MKSASKSYNIESFADSDFVSESQLSFYFPTTQEYNSNAYKVLSLFSGCGGMDLGFEGHFIANKKSFAPGCKFIEYNVNKCKYSKY